MPGLADGEPQTLADGRYRLEAELGTGATATVWRATDTLLGVSRAVKLLSRRAANSESLRRRLLAEARAMARLEHPNVLRVLDIAAEQDRDYVVMPLASAGSVADYVDSHGPLPPDLALTWMVQVLSALHLAHAHGIVHRDVKPQNILIGDDGTALLADFGIALLAEDQLRGTRTGVAMGSLAFMAPEQRIDARSVTPAADIYAAGTTLYNLLTAANPVDLFTADADSPRFLGVPPDIAAAIRRAVTYAPGDRFPDARAMALHLNALLDDASKVPIAPPPDAPRLPGWETTARRTGPTPPKDVRPPDKSLTTALTFLLDDDTGEPLVFGGTEETIPSLDTAFEPAAPRGGEGQQRPPSVTLVATTDPAAEAEEGRQSPRAWAVLLAAVALTGAVAVSVGVSRYGSHDIDSVPTGTLDAEAASQDAPAEAAKDPLAGADDSADALATAAIAERATAGGDTPSVPTITPAARDEAPAAAPDATGSTRGATQDTDQATMLTASGAPEAAPEDTTGSTAGDPDSPVGTWAGNLGASSALLSIELAGDGLVGTLKTTNPITGGSVTVPVTGHYRPGSRQVEIDEERGADADPNAGRYVVSLSDDGARLSGRFQAYAGSRSFRVELSRTSP